MAGKARDEGEDRPASPLVVPRPEEQPEDLAQVFVQPGCLEPVGELVMVGNVGNLFLVLGVGISIQGDRRQWGADAKIPFRGGDKRL